MKRQKQAIVVSTKMQRTASVAIETVQRHPKYLKQYRMTTKYLVHNDFGDLPKGTLVLLEETRPLSRHKRWKIIKVLSEHAVHIADHTHRAAGEDPIASASDMEVAA